MEPKRPVALLVLAVILAFAGFVRVRGIDFGLPMVFESDCLIPTQARMIRRGPPETSDAWRRAWEYPVLIAELTTLWPDPREVDVPADAPLEEHLAAAATVFVQSRLTVALLGLLIVPATYLLGRRFLPRGPSLVAAALVATSLLHVYFSQEARPHAAAGGLFVATLACALWMRARPGVLAYLACGLGLGASVGALQSGLMLGPPLVVAYLLREGASGRRRLFDARALLALVPLAVLVRWSYPYFFLPGEEESAELTEGTFDFSGHQIFFDELDFGGVRIVLRSLWHYEPVLSVLLVAGLALLLVRLARIVRDRGDRGDRGVRRALAGPDVLVVLAYALPYLGFLLLYGETYERFLIPLLPVFALPAAAALWGLAERASRATSPAAGAAVLALALALPTFAAHRLSALRAAPHTTRLAADWIEANLGPDEVALVAPPIELPLWRTEEGLAWAGAGIPRLLGVWTRYQERLGDRVPGPRYDVRWIRMEDGALDTVRSILDDPAPFVRGLDGDYVVTQVHSRGQGNPAGARIREELLASHERVARISPDGDPDFSDHPFADEDDNWVVPPHFTARVLRARAVGPVIEIFRLKERGR